MAQMVSAERAAASRNKCLNLAKTCRSGSGSASERTRRQVSRRWPSSLIRNMRETKRNIGWP